MPNSIYYTGFMRLFVFFLALVLFSSSLLAYCVCIKGERCGCSDDPYYEGRENVSVYVTEEQAKKANEFTYATDRPIGYEIDDTFDSSRGDYFQAGQKISIKILSSCQGQALAALLTCNNLPLADAKLSLYSHAGGREFNSQVQTNSQGYAYFSPKDAGSYDFIAQKDGYPSSQLIFQIKECPALSDKNSAPSKIQNSETAPQLSGSALQISAPGSLNIFYYKTYRRAFEQIILPGGSQATKVELIIQSSALPISNSSFYLVQAVPKSQASSISSIGFEGAYPAKTSEDENNIFLYWQIGNNIEKSFSRSYILLKNQNPNFGEFAPPSFEGQEEPTPSSSQGIDFGALSIPILGAIILIGAAAFVASKAFA